MLASEDPSPWKSSQVYAPSPGTAGFASFLFSSKKHSDTPEKSVPCHARADRAAQKKRLSLRTSCLEGGPLLCLERFTVEGRDTAKARAALRAKIELHHRSRAAFVRLLTNARAVAALDFASNCKNWAVSPDHFSPTSAVRTTGASTFPDNSGKSAFLSVASSRQ